MLGKNAFSFPFQAPQSWGILVSLCTFILFCTSRRGELLDYWESLKLITAQFMHKGECSQTTHIFLVPLPLPFPLLKMPSTSELPSLAGGGTCRQNQHQASPPRTTAVFAHMFSHICPSEPSFLLILCACMWPQPQVNRVVPLQTAKAAKTFVDICTAIENLLKCVIYTNNFYIVLCNFKYIFKYIFWNISFQKTYCFQYLTSIWP